jgi:hypothetical protein
MSVTPTDGDTLEYSHEYIRNKPDEKCTKLLAPVDATFGTYADVLLLRRRHLGNTRFLWRLSRIHHRGSQFYR